LANNQGLWTRLQRLQYRIIRTVLSLRQSTPICVILSEACEPPLKLRLEYLISRYVYESFHRRFSLLIRSLRRLEIASSFTPSTKRVYLLKNILTFKMFVLQKHILDDIHRSVIPSPFSSSLSASTPLPSFHFFGWPIPGFKPPGKDCPLNPQLRKIVLRKFKDFSSPLIGENVSIYTDGSKSDDSPVGAAIYSPELGIALKHRLPSDTSIFSVKAWAIYQALILVESSQHKKATIFSDSRSVLEALSSSHKKSNANYLVPSCRSKYHSLSQMNYTINLAWIPCWNPGQRKSGSLCETGSN